MAAAAAASGTAPDPMAVPLGSGTAAINATTYGLLVFAITKRFNKDGCKSSVLSERLHKLGQRIGRQAAESVALRGRPDSSFPTLYSAIEFLSVRGWRDLFGTEVTLITPKPGQPFTLVDSKPVCNRYISSGSGVGLAGIMAGTVAGFLDGLGFRSTTEARPVSGEGKEGKIAFLVKEL